jgi:general secretion pathway protein B
MSYILEALKKAQAERQLGNAPTIHAPAVHAAPQAAAGRKPLAIGIAAGAVLLAGALFAWRQQSAAPGKIADAGPAVQQAAPAGVAAAQAPAASATQQAPRPAAPAAGDAATIRSSSAEEAQTRAEAQVALVQDPATAVDAHALRRPQAQPAPEKPASPKTAEPTPLHAAVSTPAAPDIAPPASPVAARADSQVAARHAATPAAPPAEDTLRSLNELPESIRSNVPRVAFGGYMYSPNPADRLVLVDQVLRREGEEVAPGLVLERLLPKAAVLNYHGYRYRVPL